MLDADAPYREGISRQMARMGGDEFDPAMKQYEEKLAAWERAAGEAGATGNKVDLTTKPLPPLRPGESRGTIGHLYEKHIRPIVGFAIRGVLWDQGENGTGIEKAYNDTVTPALIRGWRRIRAGRVPLPLRAEAERWRLRMGSR